MKRTICTLLLAAATVAGLSPSAGAATATSNGTSVRAYTGLADAPDPSLLWAGDRAWVYSTGSGSFAPGSSAPTPRSTYTTAAPTLEPRKSWPTWMRRTDSRVWAPDVFVSRVDDQIVYVMYFAAADVDESSYDGHCIGIATSASPAGPFAVSDQLPFCSKGSASKVEVIDPSSFVDGDGNHWLVYKENALNKAPFAIKAVPMSPDGLSFASRTGRVLLQGNDMMENPSLIIHGTRIWMFLSRKDFANCSYYTDVRWSTSLFDQAQWNTTKRVRTFLSKGTTADVGSGGLCGAGGADVTDFATHTYVAFHAWTGGTLGVGHRTAYVGIVDWGKDKYPHLR